ncbi:MAG: DUF2914 domain-containing protein [bacterium]
MKKHCLIMFIFIMMLSLIICHVRITAAQGIQRQTASLQSPSMAPSLAVEQMAVCRNVVDREPVDGGSSFEVSAGKLYCYSKIVGAQDPVEITHVWYYNDVERARVNLPVRSANWRTYSSKVIQLFEIGNWRVDVVSPNGDVLQSEKFTITR